MTPEQLGRMFKINLSTVQANGADLTDEESRRVPGDGVNSLNWVVGHMLNSRNAVMALLDEPPVFTGPVAAVYARGGNGFVPSDGGLPLPELIAALQASQEALGAALRARTAADLAALSTNPAFEKLPGDTIGAKLGFLQFHEAYHCGQVGLLRRLLGKPGVIK